MCVCADSAVFTPRGSHPISWTLHTHTHTEHCVGVFCAFVVLRRKCVGVFSQPWSFCFFIRWRSWSGAGESVPISSLLFFCSSPALSPQSQFILKALHNTRLYSWLNIDMSQVAHSRTHSDIQTGFQTYNVWKPFFAYELVAPDVKRLLLTLYRSFSFCFFFVVNIWTELTASAALFYTLNHCVATLGLWPHLRLPRIQMELPEMTSNWF